MAVSLLKKVSDATLDVENMLSVCSLKVCMQNFKKFIYLHITLHFVGIVRATMSLCRQCNVQIGMVGWSRPLMVETWICWNANRYKNNINFDESTLHYHISSNLNLHVSWLIAILEPFIENSTLSTSFQPFLEGIHVVIGVVDCPCAIHKLTSIQYG